MNEHDGRTSCSQCGFLLADDSTPLAALPCPSCGGFGRTIEVSIVERLTLFDGYGMRLNRAGVKKPSVESISMPSLSRKLGKYVRHERLIDRENNIYHEKITDYETGETVHEQKEPLTDHVGHGSAKKKPASK